MRGMALEKSHLRKKKVVKRNLNKRFTAKKSTGGSKRRCRPFAVIKELKKKISAKSENNKNRLDS